MGSNILKDVEWQFRQWMLQKMRDIVRNAV